MKTAAVICELNPFHNGHALLMRKLREEYGADYIIALMSGNYVQRGEPAVFEKYARAEMALGGSSGGHADLVLEMPALFSTASAREFASAGVRMALVSGIADILGFGTENGAGLGELDVQAAKLDTAENFEDQAFSAAVRSGLRSGLSYPKALDAALSASDPASACVTPENQSSASSQELLPAPNNILAAEYLRALRKFDPGHSIRPVSISRVGDGYASVQAADPHFCSAAALRRMLLADGTAAASSVPEQHPAAPYVPADALSLFLKSRPLSPDAFSPYLNKALLEARYFEKDLSVYADVSREIADRLLRGSDEPMSFTARVADIKTKQYTYTRISRALLHIALGITKEETEAAKAAGYVSGLRILGFRKEAAPLLKSLKANAAVPIITKTADHKELLKTQLYCDQLYQSVSGGINEYRHSPIRL